MTIHREGYPTIAFTGIMLLLGNFVIIKAGSPIVITGMSLVISLGVWWLFIQFFRNPSRTIPTDCPNCVLAPADGVVVAIEQVYEKEYFHDTRLKISIYMSVLNVHVNRIPVDGIITYTCYHPGKHLVAYHPKSSDFNEHNTIVITNAQNQQVLVRQIAGIMARRIVSYVAPEQRVKMGEELGFIKFGSRCDVFLPPESIINVTLNQHVTGAESILAVLQNTIYPL